MIRKPHRAIFIASLATVGLLGAFSAASAQVVIGNWEAPLVGSGTPDPSDPSHNLVGGEGWIDWQNQGVYTQHTYGATLGTSSLKLQTPNVGYAQTLAIKLHSNGLIDDFLTSGQFAIDVSWNLDDYVGEGQRWSQVENLYVNTPGVGFVGRGRATHDSLRESMNLTDFFGSWDPTFGNATTTLTWDCTTLIDGNTANGEITPVPASSGGGWLELILATNYDTTNLNPALVAWYFDNVRLLPRVVTSDWTGAAPDPDNDAGNGNAATGLWFASRNWTAGVPGVRGSVANFGSNGGAITGAQTVTTNNPLTLSGLTFDFADGYSIAGTGAITMSVAAGQATISVANGSHSVANPVTLASDTTVTVTPSGSTLSLTGALTATGRTITKAGAGVLQTQAIQAAGVTINAGTVKVNSGAGTSKLSNLTIAGTTDNWSGQLDLTNNALIVEYTGPSPMSTIANQIKSGHAGGNWVGQGITSSAAAANPTKFGVGVAEASQALGASGGTFVGVSTDGTSVLARYTLLGDTNLDGTVNLGDFANLTANFNGSNKEWFNGDTDYNGLVNLGDFANLTANFNQSLAPASLPGAAIPEPTSMLAIGACAVLLLRKRRVEVGST